MFWRNSLNVPKEFLFLPLHSTEKVLLLLLKSKEGVKFTTREICEAMGYNRFYIRKLLVELNRLGFIKYNTGRSAKDTGYWCVDLNVKPKEPSKFFLGRMRARERRKGNAASAEAEVREGN